MNYDINYTATELREAAIPLRWDDFVENVAVSHQVPVWDPTSGSYITPPNITIPVTHLGVKRVVPTEAALAAAYPGARVIDGDVVIGGTAYSNGVALAEVTGGTRLITLKEVEGFSITLILPGLYAVDPATGYVAATVSLSVYYRAYDPYDPPTAATPWSVLHTDYIITAKQRAEVIKTIKHSDADLQLPLSKYEILVLRNTPSNAGNMSICDEVYIKEINEVLYRSVSYNHTALLGLVVRATDQLSGSLPTVTALVKGTKISVPSNLVEAYKNKYNPDGSYNGALVAAAYAERWDGTLGTEKVWSDNPVWCLYDLLTNKRYGLSDYYKIADSKKGLMLANFYLMAKYCDESIEYIDDTKVIPATSYRPRFTLNIVIDQSKPASTWISQIAAIMRAAYFYSEGIFWLDIDRAKPTTQIFNMTNITDFAQSSTSYKGVANAFEVQWINPASNYEVDSFKLEAKELQLNPLLEERKQALQLVGVTSLDHAKSIAKYALLAGKMRTKLVSFKTGTDGLRCMVSDVIGIQHDVPQWGYGGKVVSYNSITKEVVLSSDIVVSAGNTYYIAVVTPADESKTYSLAPMSVGPTRSVILHEDPVVEPQEGDRYIVGLTADMAAKFRVTSIKRDGNEMCQITAVEYNESLYSLCDSTSDLGEYNTTNYSLISNPQRISVQGVYSQLKYYQDSMGVWKTGVEVFYDKPDTPFWKSAQVHYSVVGAFEYTSGETNNLGYFFIPQVPANSYMIVVTSSYSTGQQTIPDALSDSARHPWTTITVDNFAPNTAFTSGVKGLSIYNEHNNTFEGKDCIITWFRPNVLDAALDTLTAGTDGAGTTSDDNWFSHYEVEISGLNGLRRSEKVYTERYIYTHEMNHTDGISRTFDVTVYAFDKLGRKSLGSTIRCSNPAPLPIQ